MRKQNSDFRAGFISEAGNRLKNNDYFGYVELDEFACYVIADGISEAADAGSARTAIETVILCFQEGPAVSKRILKRLLRKANTVMLRRESDRRLKASITVIITDYQKMRYGYAGNTRLRMYRGGNVYIQTKDMSLAREMADQEQIPKDAVMRHQERNNLYAYLGQKKFRPYLSKKIKLSETDIIVLSTKGIWENIDSAELDDVFQEAGDEVQESLDAVEDLLLSRQPDNLDNYTLAAVFVNKVYIDPGGKKKKKKLVMICLVTVLVLLIVGVIVWILYQTKKQRMVDMDYYFTNTVSYINDGNYIRAKEDCQKAQELSEKLKDNAMRRRLQEYMFVIETVIMADDCYDSGDYEGASEYFLSALERARYADNVGTEYMEKRLDRINRLLSVEDYIAMGDQLLEDEEFEKAQEQYMLAKNTAYEVHDTEGVQNAKDALEKLYDAWSEAESEERQAAGEKAAEETAAVQLETEGDKACLERDFAGAKVFYVMAQSKYDALNDTENSEKIQEKLEATEEKIREQETKLQTAQTCKAEAQACLEAGDYQGAKARYLSAQDIYRELGMGEDVLYTERRINELDGLTPPEVAMPENE